jgi:hypothetical protein
VTRVFVGPVLAGVVAVFASCGGGTPVDARYPPRPEGCDVKIFHDTPDVPTHNLGPVRSSCGDDVSDADCIRALLDEVCKLGGDVVWGVPEQPTKGDGHSHWSGRAAHRRVPRAPGDGGAP